MMDAAGALIIAKALVQNDKLLKLDLGGNELGDLGILNLVKPLIR